MSFGAARSQYGMPRSAGERRTRWIPGLRARDWDIHSAAEKHVGDTLVPGLVALVARAEHVHVERWDR
jgi:hypothetical protein